MKGVYLAVVIAEVAVMALLLIRLSAGPTMVAVCRSTVFAPRC